MTFLEFLEQSFLHESRVREGNIDIYFLPQNINKVANNTTKLKYLVEDVLNCVRILLLEYENIRLPGRDKNQKFILDIVCNNRLDYQNIIIQILTCLTYKEFIGESVLSNSTAYVFKIKISELKKRMNIKFKNNDNIRKTLYIKFDMPQKIAKTSGGSVKGIVTNILNKYKNYIAIDLKKTVIDIISLHYDE